MKVCESGCENVCEWCMSVIPSSSPSSFGGGDGSERVREMGVCGCECESVSVCMCEWMCMGDDGQGRVLRASAHHPRGRNPR